MKPGQLTWKWLLLGLIALLLLGAALLPGQIGRSSQLRDRVATALASWSGGEVALTEPFRLRYFPSMSINSGVEVRDASRLPFVQSISAEEAKISLNLADLLIGRIRVSELRLMNPRITLKEQDATGILKQETPQALIAIMLTGAPISVLRLRRGSIVEPEGEQEVVKKLDVRIDLGSDGAVSGLGSFDFRSETVRFAIDTGAPAGVEEWPNVPLRLTVTSRPIEAKLTGDLAFADSLQFNGRVQAESGNVRELMSWAGVKLPDGQSLGALAASGTMHWNGATLSVENGSFKLDGNAAEGALAMTMGERPRIEGTLDFGRLVLDPYIATRAPDKAQAERTHLLDCALLKYFDADLRLSAAEIAASGSKLGRGGFTINAKQGVISTEIGELVLCGGSAAGRVGLDLSQAMIKASVVGGLSDVALESCLAPLKLDLPFRGIAKLRADATTEGQTPEELLRGLSGTLNISASDGAVPVDFARLTPASHPEGEGWSRNILTPFDSLKADCRLAAGHIWCQMFNMQTRGGQVSGTGDIDMGRQTINWSLAATGQVGPLAASQLTSEPPLRLSIRGPWLLPMIRRADRPTLGEGATQTNPTGSVSPH